MFENSTSPVLKFSKIQQYHVFGWATFGIMGMLQKQPATNIQNVHNVCVWIALNNKQCQMTCDWHNYVFYDA